MERRNGTGMLLREVMNGFPLLSPEQEGRLNDMSVLADMCRPSSGLRIEESLTRLLTVRRYADAYYTIPMSTSGTVKVSE